MAYIVTRTINGRQYRYIQRSYRENGKVRTVTVEYLGPVSPQYDKSRHRKKEAGKGDVGMANSAGKNAPTSDPGQTNGSKANHESSATRGRQTGSASHPTSRIRPKRSVTESNKVQSVTTQSLIKNSHLGNRRVSFDRLNNESRRFTALLQQKGADPKGSIRIKWGSELHSKRFGTRITIYCPNQIDSARLRAEVHSAHARIAIRALKKAHPDKFRLLAQDATTTFEISKQCYARALELGKDWKKQFKAIAVSRWGSFQNLERNFRDPSKWGIYHYSKKRNWQDDIVSLYQESEAQGGIYKFGIALRREQKSAHRIAEHLESLRGSKRNRELERDIERANIRAAILTDNCRKLQTLNALFYSSFSVFHPDNRNNDRNGKNTRKKS